MTDPNHTVSAEPDGAPRAGIVVPDQRELRALWTDAWLNRQLINARLGDEPEVGATLYHGLTYSAARLFPESGGPRETTLAYPATLSFSDPHRESDIRPLLKKSLEELGRFSLHILDFTRREMSQWASTHGGEAQTKNITFIERTSWILEDAAKLDPSQWPRLFLRSKKNKKNRRLKSGWNGLPNEAGFFFEKIGGGSASNTNAKRLFEKALPTFMDRCEEDLASLETKNLFSKFALQGLHDSLLECIDHLSDVGNAAPCGALQRRTRQDVKDILEAAFPGDANSHPNIRSAFDNLIAILLQLNDRLQQLLGDPTNFEFLQPHPDLRPLTRKERDIHLQQLAVAPTSDRLSGAPMARLLLDAIDNADCQHASIGGLDDWLEAIAALYIQVDAKDQSGKPLVARLNHRIRVALQRYQKIFQQASDYCDQMGIVSIEKRHFIARIWLMAAGFKAVWQRHLAGDHGSLTAQLKVLSLYLNAIVAHCNGTAGDKPRRNFVEAGVFEWNPLAPAFLACNEILKEFRRENHFDWQLEHPPTQPRMNPTPPNTVHDLYSEYMIQNEFTKPNNRGKYYLNRRLDQLGLPLVGTGALDGR